MSHYLSQLAEFALQPNHQSDNLVQPRLASRFEPVDNAPGAATSDEATLNISDNAQNAQRNAYDRSAETHPVFQTHIVKERVIQREPVAVPPNPLQNPMTTGLLNSQSLTFTPTAAPVSQAVRAESINEPYPSLDRRHQVAHSDLQPVSFAGINPHQEHNSNPVPVAQSAPLLHAQQSNVEPRPVNEESLLQRLNLLRDDSGRQASAQPLSKTAPQEAPAPVKPAQINVKRPGDNSQKIVRQTPFSQTDAPLAETVPTIQVSIGRIEIRAQQTNATNTSAKKSRPSAAMSLDDYVKQRNGENP